MREVWRLSRPSKLANVVAATPVIAIHWLAGGINLSKIFQAHPAKSGPNRAIYLCTLVNPTAPYPTDRETGCSICTHKNTICQGTEGFF